MCALFIIGSPIASGVSQPCHIMFQIIGHKGAFSCPSHLDQASSRAEPALSGRRVCLLPSAPLLANGAGVCVCVHACVRAGREGLIDDDDEMRAVVVVVVVAVLECVNLFFLLFCQCARRRVRQGEQWKTGPGGARKYDHRTTKRRRHVTRS